MRVWQEGLDWAMEKVCKSALDIKIFNAIKQSMDRYGEYRGNQSEMAETLGTSRMSISRVIGRMKDINLLKQKGKGIYEFNPFILAPKGSSNEEIEKRQFEWSEGGSIPTLDSIQSFGKF